ncbi:MAG: class I SAM-dependent methyltransferase [Gloeotrichia echinulata GP01]|jgi:predicted SAM-dependent methyltransferase
MIRDKLPSNWVQVYDSIRFEVNTSIGLAIQRFRELPTSVSYLHVGCGENLIPNFLNTDVFSNKKADYGIDLRFTLPFKDVTFQGIYAHHVVEHLSYESAKIFFNESRRILCKDGILRIAVPDVEKFIFKYIQNFQDGADVALLLPEWHRQTEWKTSLEVVDYVFRDTYFNKHLSSWDFYTLKYRLEEAGFRKIMRVECGISNDEKLCNLDYKDWKDQSLYIEAYK